jgi:hypothetical protein
MEQRIAVHANFGGSRAHGSLWGKLATRHDVVAIAIFDDWDVLAGVKSSLQASGIKLFGRVSTHKGTTPREVCSALIDDWFHEHADLDGIFVDEGPPIDSQTPEEHESEWVWDYYGDDSGQGMYRYIKGKKPDAIVFLNCPGCRDAAVFGACDIAEVVEHDYGHYMVRAWWTGTHEPWWTNPPAGKAVAHVVRSCPDAWSMRVAVGLSKARGAKYVYVFDASSNVLSSLPAYWDAEATAVADTPAEPCQLVADVLPDITRAIDDLSAQLDRANSDDKGLLIQEAARLEMQRADVEVILKECQEG